MTLLAGRIYLVIQETEDHILIRRISAKSAHKLCPGYNNAIIAIQYYGIGELDICIPNDALKLHQPRD